VSGPPFMTCAPRFRVSSTYLLESFSQMTILPHIFLFSALPIIINGLNNRGEFFIKDFRKDWNCLQNSQIKQSRKAIKQWLRNCLQNFNQLKLRFNRLFIAATKAELKQIVIKSEREKDLISQFYSGLLNLELHPVPRITTGFH